MEMTKDSREFRNDDPIWFPFGEDLLSEAVLDEDLETMLVSRPIFQTMQELGLPPERLKRIRRTVTETARHYLHRMPGGHMRIRLFYQPKMVTGQPHSEKRVEGGWGYFIIQRGKENPSAVYSESYPIIELYIYREGK